MSQLQPLTTTDILAATSRILLDAGYKQMSDTMAGRWLSPAARLFEDAYGLVAVHAYASLDVLLSGWVDAQSALVELISRHLGKQDSKAADGYLVLFSAQGAQELYLDAIDDIRYDTSYVRKIVGVAEELTSLADVEATLQPLLPLHADEESRDYGPVLQRLPNMLSQKGVPASAVQTVVDAFQEHSSIMEALHTYRGAQ